MLVNSLILIYFNLIEIGTQTNIIVLLKIDINKVIKCDLIVLLLIYIIHIFYSD